MANACSPPPTFRAPDGATGDAGVLDATLDATLDAAPACNRCSGAVYTPCNADRTPAEPVRCPAACVHERGCVACVPGRSVCVGHEVHRCDEEGAPLAEVTETCDLEAGQRCHEGACVSACQLAENQPSNVGCEFWAVDLDQQDALNDPASAPWGVALSNVGDAPARVTIERNAAPVGQPVQLQLVQELTVPPMSLRPLRLPTRELDCGVRPNDYNAPGTCLSSNAYRIRSNAPILVYQFNVFENAFSNDASLLLPASSLGREYRVIGWPAGHPIRVLGAIDRSYVTVVGVRAGTQVTVHPSFRIRGNGPIAATRAGGELTVTLGPFDVLNLETDDGALSDPIATMADLSGTLVRASQPVAVFSGVESTSAPGAVLEVPTPAGWESSHTCCLDHLEEQLFPVESIGTRYVIARSPVRSRGGFREADIVRFVGAAETARVTTTLPPPFDAFTLEPGEVRTTWTQDNIIVEADKPVIVGQILVSNQYCEGRNIGDPSLTVLPPVDQFRREYVVLTPGSWSESWAVFVAEPGVELTVDGATPPGCEIESVGEIAGIAYQSRRCLLTEGVHRVVGERPFGVVVYGYGAAGSYAFVGGADVRRIYDPPG